MYARLVGNGVITPDYFFHSLRLSEAHDLLRELGDAEERAARLGFIHQRFTAGIIYKTLTGKVLDLTFPWEEDSEVENDDEMSQEEVERTRRELLELNNRNGDEDKRQTAGSMD